MSFDWLSDWASDSVDESSGFVRITSVNTPINTYSPVHLQHDIEATLRVLGIDAAEGDTHAVLVPVEIEL